MTAAAAYSVAGAICYRVVVVAWGGGIWKQGIVGLMLYAGGKALFGIK